MNSLLLSLVPNEGRLVHYKIIDAQHNSLLNIVTVERVGHRMQMDNISEEGQGRHLRSEVVDVRHSRYIVECIR